jgi:peptide chain release factor 2
VASFRTCGGFFDLATAQRRLGELDALMAAESFWNNREQAQKLIDEANTLRGRVDPLIKAEKQLEDFQVMVELAEGEPEAQQMKHQQELERDLKKFSGDLDELELKVFLSGSQDKNNCVLSINAGREGPSRAIGRTCSCECTNAGRKRGWEVEVTDALAGETAGIKSVTMLISGEYAYGYCKAERGVHRLVRISPFDANKRRHTSFASIDVIAEIEEAPDIEFRRATLRSIRFAREARAGRTSTKLRQQCGSSTFRPVWSPRAKASGRNIRTAPRR